MPSLGDYDEAMKIPRSRFKDGKLRSGQVERSKATGDPYKASGSYAVVYKYYFLENGTPSETRAIRCWLNPAKVDGDRLSALQRHLHAYARDITIQFRFLEEGVRLAQDKPYLPLLDMEWVDGKELREQVAKLVEDEDTHGLRALADGWLALVAQMRAAHIAHGDLSGANIMVRQDGSLTLVDYDGMYIPPFRGEQREVVGVPGYQRPDLPRPYDEDMDRFSALLIYVALCAVADSQPLWRAYTKYSVDDSTHLESDQLLFQLDDLRSPDTSSLFHDLESRCAPATQALARALHAACRVPLDQCPDVVELADPEYLAKRAHAALQRAIVVGDDDEIVRAADDPALQGYAPASGYEVVDQARARMRQIHDLRDAIAAGDDERVVEVWGRVKTFPAAAAYQSAYQQALRRIASINLLRLAIAADDPAQILQLAAELPGAALGAYQPDIARAQAIQRRRRQMDEALAGQDDQRVFDLWNDMLNGEGGRADPQLGHYEPQAQAAKNRVSHLAALVQAAKTQDDRELARLEPLYDGYPIAKPYAQDLQHARERVRVYPAIEQALRTGDDMQALLMWDQYMFADKPLGAGLRHQIDEARARWIDQVDPKGGVADIHGDRLMVRWRWPEGVSLVGITVRTDHFASQPGASDRYISRREYEAQGGFVCHVDPAPTYYIRLFSFFETMHRRLMSPGRHPEASLQLSGGLTVYYSGEAAPSVTDGPLFLLRIRSADGRPLPPLRVLARQGQRLLSEQDHGCQVLHEVDGYERGARTGALEVRIVRAQLPPGPHYVRVFPAWPDGGLMLVGQPEDNLVIV